MLLVREGRYARELQKNQEPKQCFWFKKKVFASRDPKRHLGNSEIRSPKESPGEARKTP